MLLLGRRDDIPELLAAADLVVLPSRWEARALIAQEALHAGVPLVATAVGGMPELVGDAAVLVPYGDPPRWPRAVTALLADPARRAALSIAGRAQAATWPTEDDTVAQVLSVYDELTQRPRADPAAGRLTGAGRWARRAGAALAARVGPRTPAAPAAVLGRPEQRGRRARTPDPGQAPRKAPAAVSRSAVSISGTWLNACGKLPTWRWRRGSHSSASRPRSLRSASSFSNSRRASSTRPIIARSSASQKRAGQEGALVAGQAVEVLVAAGVALGRVAQHEAVLGGQLPLDRLDRADDPLVVRRQEAHLRDEQQRRVQLPGAVGLGEGVALPVVALLAHVVVDLVAQLLEPLQRAVDLAGLDRA